MKQKREKEPITYIPKKPSNISKSMTQNQSANNSHISNTDKGENVGNARSSSELNWIYCIQKVCTLHNYM